jgi:rhodanese-related sulfurtransferase
MTTEHDYLALLALAALVCAAAVAWFVRRRAQAKPAAPDMLSVDQLKAQLDSRSGRVLDVRTPPDFNGEQGHIAGAFNLPLEELPSRLAELGPDRGQRIAIVCRTDRKSAAAAALLAAHGFTAAHAVRGGMTAWRERGWPTEKQICPRASRQRT